jgi:hypothetical protein
VVVLSVVLIGLFVGYLGGSIRVVASTESCLRDLAGSSLRVEAVVTGQVRSNAGWQSAIAVVRDTSAGALGPTDASGAVRNAAAREASGVAGEKVLLELAPADGPDTVTLSQGQNVAFAGTVRLPDGPSSSGFDQAAYPRTRGSGPPGRSDDVSVIGRRAGSRAASIACAPRADISAEVPIDAWTRSSGVVVEMGRQTRPGPKLSGGPGRPTYR